MVCIVESRLGFLKYLPNSLLVFLSPNLNAKIERVEYSILFRQSCGESPTVGETGKLPTSWITTRTEILEMADFNSRKCKVLYLQMNCRNACYTLR